MTDLIMALSENPKKIAEDVATGMRTFNRANLRRLQPPDLKIIVEHLNAAQVAIRQEIVPMDDPGYMEKTKDKNRRTGRIRNALTIIRNHVHRTGAKGVF
jgi:hypothetical protein